MFAAFEQLESRRMMSVTPVPMISAAQEANLQKLASDLKTIHSQSDVTTAEVSALVADLKSIAAVATKPDPTLVTQFTTALKTDFEAGPLTAKEKAQLYTDFSDILISANIPASLAQAVNSDVKAIVVSSNVTSTQVKLIESDLLAIVTTFEANH